MMMGAGENKRWINADACAVKCRAISIEPRLVAQHRSASCNDPDPSVAQADEVFGRSHAARPIRHPDRRRARLRVSNRVNDH
jgi:hypothetical protein